MYFLKITKLSFWILIKLQGLSTNFTFGTDKNKTNVFASAALVGAIREEHFTGIEGSQGPYKLKGTNGNCMSLSYQVLKEFM
jgi:hypothetical protein